jgi:hypothetical protein
MDHAFQSKTIPPSAISLEMLFGASLYITFFLFIFISPFSPIPGSKYTDIFISHSILAAWMPLHKKSRPQAAL